MNQLSPASYKTADRQNMMMPRSIAKDKKKVGSVTLVGRAARLVINAIPIAAIAKGMATGLFPVVTITNKVSGVKKQPCANKITASQTNRLSFWFLHHVIKRVSIDGLRMAGV